MGTEDYLKNAEPGWLNTLAKAKKEQGRTLFLLHFNIRDIVFDPAHPPDSPAELRTISEFIAEMFSHRDVVLYYSLHSGIEIYKGGSKQEEKRFQERGTNRLWEEVARTAASAPFPLGEGSPPPERWSDPAHAIALLTRTLTHPYSIALPRTPTERAAPDGKEGNAPRGLSIGLIIDYLHHLTPDATVLGTRHEVAPLVETFQRWSTDSTLLAHNHIVVLLAPELAAVHPELRGTDSRITTIQVPRPTAEERASFLAWLATCAEPDGSHPYAPLQEEETRDKLANRTAGMNYLELRDFARHLHHLPAEGWHTALEARRAEIIHRASGGLLVPKESRFGLDDVAGYGYVREPIDRLIKQLSKRKADLTGILFTGPPGTGKSFFAGAMARDAGVNVVVMRNVRHGLVGASERNLEQVLDVARSLSPVVIFVDEIDQAFSSRSGQNLDGGVEQRLLGRLLEFMDDKENLGRVIWVAASNRPDLLDEALLSRFKLRIPFLLPDREACLALLKSQLPFQSDFTWQVGTWSDQLEQAIEKGDVGDEYRQKPVIGVYSGRELDTIVRDALWRAEAAEAEREKNLEQTPPSSPTDRAPIQYLQGKKPSKAVDARYLIEALRNASLGHSHQAYLRQSLLALHATPFNSPALAQAVRTALPSRIVDDILQGDELDKEEIERHLGQLRPLPRWE